MRATLNAPAGCTPSTRRTPETGAWVLPVPDTLGWLLTLGEHPCFLSHTGGTPILLREPHLYQLTSWPETAELRF